MLSIKYVKENIELVKQSTSNKKCKVDFEKLLSLDETKKQLLPKAEDLKSRRNNLSKEIGKLIKDGTQVDEQKNEVSLISDEIKVLDKEIEEISTELNKLLIQIPNVIHESVPIGSDESFNKVIHQRGIIRDFDFVVKDHLDLLTNLDLLDMERGTKLSGSGFPVFKSKGAKLVRSLINMFLDVHINKQSYTEINVPLLVSETSVYSSGQLPDKEALMYKTKDENLYLIPTSEVSLVNLYRDEIITLPVNITAYTPCFRREAGSYGKTVRGINRIHQFDKVEMVKMVHPDTSYDELEKITENAEELLDLLELPYRRIVLCSGDMGMTQSKTYDLEVWSPAQNKWLEVSSCSNCTDYQSTRANIRFKNPKTNKTEFVHTLNGSGLALPRIIIGLVENNQNVDGTVSIPKALQSYTNFNTL